MKGTRKIIKLRSQKRVRAFVSQAVEMLSRRLVADQGIPEAKAVELARNCIHDICGAFGGAFLYVPKDVEFELSRRDREIFDKFDGNNIPELVQEFGLSFVRIYQIIAAVKAEELRKRQGRLPGLDEEGVTA